MRHISLFILLLIFKLNLAQNNSVGIGTITPHPSALLELQASDKGILIPRITDTNLVLSPATGVLIYLTTNNTFYYFDGVHWRPIISGSNTQVLIGSTGITGATGAIGNTGNAGITGATGSTGNTGITGATGADGSQNAWSLTGNAGTSPPTNFIGTTDFADWTVKTNNAERLRVTANGNAGIGTSSPDNSAILHLDAPDKGFITPRITTAQRDAIASPAEALLIFNTDTKCFNYFKLGAWYELCGTCTPQPTTANAGPDQLNISGSSTILAGNTPASGTGAWSISSGTGGAITSANNPASSFSGVVGNSYILKWTITSSCGSSSDSVQISFSSSPPPPPPPSCASTNKQFLFTTGKQNLGNNYGYSCLQRTDECRYLLSGSTNNWGAGNTDILLVNIDTNGAFQWAKTIGGTGIDGGGYLKNTNGGYILGGHSTTWGSGGKSGLLITQFDGSHTVLWSSMVSSTNDISSVAIGVAPDGSIYNGGTCNFPSYIGFVTKLNSSGVHQWSKIIGADTTAPSPWSDYYQDYAATTDNGVITAGWSWSYRMTGAGNRQGIVIKFNSGGGIDWAKIIGTGSGGLEGFDISCVAPAASGYIIAGTSGTNSQLTLVKIDASGNLVWAKRTNESGSPSRIIETSDGGFLIAGKSPAWQPNNKLSRVQWKLDSSGNIVWTMSDISILDGHPNPWEWDFQPIEVDDGYITAGFSHRHTDAYAETQLSLQKFKYDGTTCEESSVSCTISSATDVVINDITSTVQTYLQTAPVNLSNPTITPASVAPDNWTDCSQ